MARTSPPFLLMNTRPTMSARRGWAIRFLTGWPWILVLLAGCGGGRTAAVSGKVTYHGKAVTGGSLTFTPIPAGGDREPGKPGAAEVQPDGHYVVGTYSQSDGAVIGRHRV